VESGAHNELLARRGTYWKLWQRQSGGFLQEEVRELTVAVGK
jgi:hypothetical protein